MPLKLCGSRGFPDLELSTGARRHSSNTAVLQETLENVPDATFVYFSGPCSDLGHLGHSRNSLIDRLID